MNGVGPPVTAQGVPGIIVVHRDGVGRSRLIGGTGMFGKTPMVMIEDDAALATMVEAVRGVPVVGVDTEADSFHSYQEKVCLVQLSDLQTDYIIDPLSIEDMSPLGDIMADPQTVKVLKFPNFKNSET